MPDQVLANTTGAFEGDQTSSPPYVARFGIKWIDALNLGSSAITLPNVTAGTQVKNPSVAGLLCTYKLDGVTPPNAGIQLTATTDNAGLLAGIAIDTIAVTATTGGAGSGAVQKWPTGRIVTEGIVLCVADGSITQYDAVGIPGTTAGRVASLGAPGATTVVTNVMGIALFGATVGQGVWCYIRKM